MPPLSALSRLALLSLSSLLALLALLGPGAARGQGGHPPIQGPRAVHDRLEAADLVVRAQVAGVELGRIRLTHGESLVGSASKEFEVKRSPLAPPPLAAGDQVILFLRGARSPYVLEDAPSEVIRLSGAEQEARWDGAVRALVGARGDPAAMSRVYLDWVDGGPVTLRGLGATGISSLLSANPALEAAIAETRVALAVDMATPAAARRVSAGLAARSPKAAARLCRALAGGEHPLDPGVADAALRGCALAGASETLDLLARAATDPDVQVRMAAARTLPAAAALAPAQTLELARAMANGESERSIREAAERIVRDASRPRREPRRPER